MKTMLLLCALLLASAADGKPPKKTAQKKPPEKVQMPDTDCKLASGKTHDEVAGKMHIKGTCKSLASTFAPDASCAIPEGYRRTKGNEVNGTVVQKSNWWLTAGPSDAIWRSYDFEVKKGAKTLHYRLRTEYHCHNPGEKGPQGWHKGVTVYIQK